MCFNVCFSWNWNRYRAASEYWLRKCALVVSIFFVPIVVIIELVVILFFFFAVPFYFVPIVFLIVILAAVVFFCVPEDTILSESATAVTEKLAIWGMPEITSLAFLAKPVRVKSAWGAIVVAAW